MQQQQIQETFALCLHLGHASSSTAVCRLLITWKANVARAQWPLWHATLATQQQQSQQQQHCLLEPPAVVGAETNSNARIRDIILVGAGTSC